MGKSKKQNNDVDIIKATTSDISWLERNNVELVSIENLNTNVSKTNVRVLITEKGIAYAKRLAERNCEKCEKSKSTKAVLQRNHSKQVKMLHKNLNFLSDDEENMADLKLLLSRADKRKKNYSENSFKATKRQKNVARCTNLRLSPKQFSDLLNETSTKLTQTVSSVLHASLMPKDSKDAGTCTTDDPIFDLVDQLEQPDETTAADNEIQSNQSKKSLKKVMSAIFEGVGNYQGIPEEMLEQEQLSNDSVMDMSQWLDLIGTK